MGDTVVDIAMRDISALMRAYKRYMDRPNPEKRERCETAHNRACATLGSDAFASVLDPLLAQVVDDGNATAMQARRNLRLVTDDIFSAEVRLLRRLGLTDRKIKTSLREAEAFLEGAGDRDAPLVRTSSDLVRELGHLRTLILDAVGVSVLRPRRAKKRDRARVQRCASRHIHSVGYLVADASARHVFTYSYAWALGMRFGSGISVDASAEGFGEAAA